MEYIDIEGTEVPRVGFGTWELTGATAFESVSHALKVGYRHIDTAQMYGNEEEVGRAIAESGLDRDEIFLTTKVPPRNAAPEDVIRSHEDSLRKLRTDHVDLLLLHWPAEPPMEETLGALDELRQQGKTRFIGVSNYPSDLLKQAVDLVPVVTDQVEYHPFLGQDEVLSVVREHGLFLTAYSPLSKGDVVGTELLEGIGRPHGKSAAQVAIRWLLQQDRVVAIPRSSSKDHIEANLDVFDFELSDEDMERIAGLPKDERKIDPPGGPDWD